MLAMVAACGVLASGGPAAAHEVQPAIAELAVAPERVELELRLAIEAPLAGIDLEGLVDTNDAPNAADYDALRALEPAALEARTRAAWPDLAGQLTLRAGDTQISPELEAVEVPPVGDAALPRDTVLRLSAALPPDGSPATFGWAPALGPVIVRQRAPGGGATDPDAYAVFLEGGQTSAALPREGLAREGALASFGRYVWLGVTHIVPKGLDHILFVLGLFFLSFQWRPLLGQVTAFTGAHTVTLALASLGYVTVPAGIVEPLIAASIAYIAVENILRPVITPWRTAVVFGFGLLHGLGFASVLGDLGVAPGAFVRSLIGFNIGVELGQIAVLAIAFLAVGLRFGDRSWYRARIAIPASAAIGLVGLYWTVERVAGQLA